MLQGVFASKLEPERHRRCGWLTSSMLLLWDKAGTCGPDAMNDVSRFNEAIDQAIAESVDYFTSEVDRWRAIFLGMLGHDLRGPLNAVLLTSQLIRHRARVPR
jgi:hypothetical protein